MHDLLNRGHRVATRAARVAFAFVIMNYSAVVALGAVILRKKKVWR